MEFEEMTDPGVWVDLAINVGTALAIIILALWISGWVANRIRKIPEKQEEFDPTLARFFASIVRYAILAFAGIAVLSQFGIQTTSLAALVGAAGLAVGLALQGTLSHLASGVMLVMFRPFKVGDFVVVGGQMGTVDEIALFTTKLTTVDNVAIIVPNGDVFSGVITNYSANDTRRCDMVFGVSYDADLKKAEEVIWKIVNADERVMKDPEPFVKVTNLGDFSVDFTLRLWCNAADYWDLKFNTTRAIKDEFDAAGIDIPFPTSIEIQKDA
ncbi:MAG: mechanosensitive ion channel [Rhodobacteraceae bacterium]|nr:mechanosensitive ion channel [Paracoccaceae bacterium]